MGRLNLKNDKEESPQKSKEQHRKSAPENTEVVIVKSTINNGVRNDGTFRKG